MASSCMLTCGWIKAFWHTSIIHQGLESDLLDRRSRYLTAFDEYPADLSPLLINRVVHHGPERALGDNT